MKRKIAPKQIEGPKFSSGQVVSAGASNHSVDNYGVVQWERDGIVEVWFPDGDKLEYTLGDLRALNQQERGRL